MKTWLTAARPTTVPGCRFIVRMFQDRPRGQGLNDLLYRILDVAIEVADADKGTLQRVDDDSE
jgi:hypothetical protein